MVNLLLGLSFILHPKRHRRKLWSIKPVEYLQENSPEQAFNLFTTRDSIFIHGDLFMFTYDCRRDTPC